VGWLSWPLADTPESTDMSIFGGLVKADLSVKIWGQKFKTFAADLPQLMQPAPKLPPFDFAGAFTAEDKELAQMHRSYVESVGQAVDKTGGRNKESR